MSTDLITVSQNSAVSEADKLMKMHNIRHLPVVDTFGELTGIVSLQDVAKTYNKTTKIASIMNSRIQIIKSEANIKKTIEQMLKFKISSMLVAHNREIVGIITTDDLIQLLYELIDEDEHLISIDAASLIDEDWDRTEDEEEQIREVELNIERLA